MGSIMRRSRGFDLRRGGKAGAASDVVVMPARPRAFVMDSDVQKGIGKLLFGLERLAI